VLGLEGPASVASMLSARGQRIIVIARDRVHQGQELVLQVDQVGRHPLHAEATGTDIEMARELVRPEELGLLV